MNFVENLLKREPRRVKPQMQKGKRKRKR